MILGISLLISVGIFVYIFSRPGELGFALGAHGRLGEERERLVLVLKELELDYALKNLDQGSYQRSKALYEQELLEVLKKIDAIG